MKKRGSLTVEASLVLPIFLLAMLQLIYLDKLLLYEEKVQWALTCVGREYSVDKALNKKTKVPDSVYLATKMSGCLKGSGLQVSMLRSRYDEEEETLHMVADYRVQGFWFRQRSVSRAFTGVETRGKREEKDLSRVVYVTKTGRVYHQTLSCTYLKLSISQVKYGDLEHLRSEGGGKYYPCESCGKEGGNLANEDVFICNYGNRYHRFRGCKKIKRSIEEITLSEVGSRLPCSKCGMEE